MVVVTFLAPSALLKWSTCSRKSNNKCNNRKFAVSVTFFSDVMGTGNEESLAQILFLCPVLTEYEIFG